MKLFIEWIAHYSEAHFQVIRAIYRKPGSTRREIWQQIHGANVRAFEADRIDEEAYRGGPAGRFIDFASGRLDHFFGRAKVAQSPSNCWALCVDCDARKTVSDPSSAFWLERFILHAIRHGFSSEQLRAEDRLCFVQTRAGLSVRGDSV